MLSYVAENQVLMAREGGIEALIDLLDSEHDLIQRFLLLFFRTFFCSSLFLLYVTYFDLSCTAMYCTVLYCTVLYCTVLYCTVLYCTVLYCTVLYCTVLY
jgi:hypothetical protein